MGKSFLRLAAATAAAAGLATALAPGASAQVQPYRTNDPGGFWNILPPGASGLANGPQLAAFLAACPPTGSQDCPTAPRPPHSADELSMYGNLVYAAPGLKREDLEKYYKDASFGVRDGDVERTYAPRADVTIVRDKRFGVPHVYGRTRAGAMFGLGYAGSEDRLFLMDALRNAGRSQLSAFAGGSKGNRDMDRDTWQVAPYTEADFRRQYELGDDVYGAAGKALQDDVSNYVAGINAYIDEAKANPVKMPGEYAGIGRPGGPEPWKVTDVIATAALIGGIFGKGGGGELDSALVLQEAQHRFGRSVGRRVWRDLRTADDEEAPTTVTGKKRFPYQDKPRRMKKDGVAMPDPGTVKKESFVTGSSASGSSTAASGSSGLLRGLLDVEGGSNALLVSPRESESGRALAVFGPQTAYFAPQLLMDIDVHAPSIDARGATFAGIGLYVLLGRGRDYAWSATSAGQDIIDTFALELCEPGGKEATTSSNHYRYKGQCLPFEKLEQRNSWVPSAGDQTPPGSETLTALRSRLGIVSARAKVNGKPVAYTKLRATYMHEADSALGFVDLNNPNAIKGPKDFQNAAEKIGFTFNWFYVDPENVAFYNSGWNPRRVSGTSNDFPVHGQYEWQGWNTDLWSSQHTPFSQHPQAINQPYFANWNNKQAKGYRAADDNYSYGSIYRSQMLEDRIKTGIKGAGKMSLTEVVDAMEDAGTVDLRGAKVLPYAFRVLGKQSDPALREALGALHAWYKGGAHRRDLDRNGVYEHTDAIRIMDAWWPRWLEAQFQPVLGKDLFKRLDSIRDPDDEPNAHGTHVGSAYNGGWYHYVHKDLRTLLGKRRTRGLRRPPPRARRYSRIYCGGEQRDNGNLSRCRQRLAQSLKEALSVKSQDLYRDDTCGDYGRQGSQWCFDAVWHRPVGGVNQPLIHWINRPTFQQVVEIPNRAGR